jgi:hypothetical protein
MKQAELFDQNSNSKTTWKWNIGRIIMSTTLFSHSSHILVYNKNNISNNTNQNMNYLRTFYILKGQMLTTLYFVRYEVFTAVTMKNAAFWDVVLCRSYVNRRFGGTYHLYFQGRKIRELGTIMSRY